jgi:hypothetical protein
LPAPSTQPRVDRSRHVTAVAGPPLRRYPGLGQLLSPRPR